MSDNVFRTLQNRPIFWCGPDNLTHRVECAEVHPGIRLLWTDCVKDVPADTAFLPGTDDVVTCPECLRLNKDGRA